MVGLMVSGPHCEQGESVRGVDDVSGGHGLLSRGLDGRRLAMLAM